MFAIRLSLNELRLNKCASMRLESRVLVWWNTNHGLENFHVMMFTDGQVSFKIDVFVCV